MKKTLNIFQSGSLFIFAMLSMTVLQTILSLALTSVTASFGGMPVINWVIYFANQIAIIGTVVVFLKVSNADFKRNTRVLNKVNIWQLLLTPLIAAATIVAFLPLSNMFSELLKILGFKGGISVPLSGEALPFALSIVFICIMPALGEELLLRGAVLTGLRTKSPFFAVLISSLLFSLMHANAYQTVYQFFFGIVLALVCIMSKSLIPSIIIHFLNNAISLTLSVFAPSLNALTISLSNIYIWIACIVVGIFVLLFLLYLFYTVSKEKNQAGKVWSKTEYDGFSLYTNDETAKELNAAKGKVRIYGFFGFFKSFFSKRGLKNISLALQDELSGIADPKEKHLSIWFAVGFAAFWWIVSLIRGFV